MTDDISEYDGGKDDKPPSRTKGVPRVIRQGVNRDCGRSFEQSPRDEQDQHYERFAPPTSGKSNCGH